MDVAYVELMLVMLARAKYRRFYTNTFFRKENLRSIGYGCNNASSSYIQHFFVCQMSKAL